MFFLLRCQISNLFHTNFHNSPLCSLISQYYASLVITHCSYLSQSILPSPLECCFFPPSIFPAILSLSYSFYLLSSSLSIYYNRQAVEWGEGDQKGGRGRGRDSPCSCLCAQSYLPSVPVSNSLHSTCSLVRSGSYQPLFLLSQSLSREWSPTHSRTPVERDY